MANLQGEVCTRPPTCQGNCALIKDFGMFVAGLPCGDKARSLVGKAAIYGAKKIGSKAMTSFIMGLPALSCGELYGKAADYAYEHGDSFIECHPASVTPPSSAKP